MDDRRPAQAGHRTRPTGRLTPQHAADLRFRGQLACWFRSGSAGFLASTASMTPRPRSSASGNRCNGTVRYQNSPNAFRRPSANRGDPGASYAAGIRLAEQWRCLGWSGWGSFRRAFRDGGGGGQHRELGDQAVQDPAGLSRAVAAGGAWRGEQGLLAAGGVGHGPRPLAALLPALDRARAAAAPRGAVL